MSKVKSSRKTILVFLVITTLGSAGYMSAEEAAKVDYVAVDLHAEAYTVYMGFPKTYLPTFLGDLDKQTGNPGVSRDKVKVVTLQEFRDNLDALVKKRIVINDYPEQDVANGLFELIKLEAGLQWGLTWNGGIALTRNDYQFAEMNYSKFKKGKSWKKLPPQSDAVNPGHHLRLLDPNYRKQLTEDEKPKRQ